VELKDAFGKADASATDIIDEFAKGLPIIGGFYRTGSNIRELFTGEKAAIREANEELKRQDELFTQRLKSIHDYTSAIEALDKKLKALKNPGLPETAEEIAKGAKGALAEISAADKALLADLNDKIKKANAAVERARDMHNVDVTGGGGAPYEEATKENDADFAAAMEDVEQYTAQLTAARTRIANSRAKKEAEIDQKANEIAVAENDKYLKDQMKQEAERVSQQNDYLLSVEEKARENQTSARIEGLRAQGKEVDAAIAEVEAERDRVITAAIIEEQKKIAEFNDPQFTSKAEADLNRFIQTETDKANAAVDRIRAQAALKETKELPKYQLARQDEGRRFNMATLTERFEPPKMSDKQLEMEKQHQATLEQIAKNTAALKALDVQAVSVFGSGG
jgi:hypothetical protein